MFNSMPTKTTAHVVLLFLSLKFIAPTNISSYYCHYYDHVYHKSDRLCGLVVRVSGYRYRGPGFDPRRYQIF